METIKTPEKELLFTDQDEIDRLSKRIELTMPFMQAIFDEYNKIPGAKPLDTESFQSIFANLDAFIDGCKVYWYQQTHAANHQSFGITQTKGIMLVDDQLPNYQPFDDAVMDYKELFCNNHIAGYNYCGPDAFEIADNAVIVSQAYIDFNTESSKFYLEYETELKVRDTLNSIADNFKALDKLIHPNVLDFKVIGSNAVMVDFNQLHHVLDVQYPRFEGEVLQINQRIEFYRRLKQYLRMYGDNNQA